MALKVTDHAHAKDIIGAVRALSQNKVLVGVPDTTAGRNLGKGQNLTGTALGSAAGSSITNAAIAYIQNFGSPKAHIPAREFMASGILTVRDQIVRTLRAAAGFAMDGDKASTIQALHAVGIIAQNGIRRKITTGPFLPLAKATIQGRKTPSGKRKGRVDQYASLAAARALGIAVDSSDHNQLTNVRPLIDTGQLRRSITYVLRGRWF